MSHAQITQPLVSLIVPIYNVADYLEQCLASIQAQTYKNIEIICVNDGSTDSSLSLIKTCAALDSRIVVIDKPNEGYGASCNCGIAAAHGVWIAIVEPDDYLEPDMIATLINLIDTYGGEKNVDIARSAYWRVFDKQKNNLAYKKRFNTRHSNTIETRIPCAYKGRVKPKKQPCTIDSAEQLLLHHPAIWTALYRKDFLATHNICFKEIPGAGWADNPFLIESHCCGARIVYTDVCLYNYRENGYAEATLFAQTHPTIPLERWNDMMDIVDAHTITSPQVRDALIVRGINYAILTNNALIWREKQGINDTNDQQARTLLTRSFNRMDAQRVFANPAIAPFGKALFAQARGLSLPKENRFTRSIYLIKEGIFRLKNDGIAQTFKSLKERH